MSTENDKIKRNVLAIKTGKQGQILLDDAIEKCRLTVLAIKLGIQWHVLLDDSVRSQKSVFVRLKGQGTLFTINKIDDETPNVTDNKIDLKMQLWKLPEDELKKMLIDLPPWRIYNVVPFSYVLEKPQTFQFQIVPESIDENDLFLLKPTDETLNQTTDETEHQAIKKIGKRSNKELHRIFWRAFTSLRDEHGFDPKSKEVWEIIHDELKAEDQLREKKEFPPIRTYDPHDHIEIINSVHDPKPKLQWLIRGSDTGISPRISEQGTFSFSTLSSLLTRLKKNPPKV